MDKNKFKGMQMYKGFTQKDTANILGISEVSLSKKINQRDGADFKRKEIDKIVNAWNLTSDETNDIFYSNNVSKNDTMVIWNEYV